ncbi:uncharacterized protein DDB_G0283697-like [Helianthus annuus]|uniref:uncharacterized protein DDB_G0283697-like n=1 Tax=Helianthus annuus TaxID=4232 RepID=UPI000B902F28|nr:uncharacterized protein DDB_G0283697-like [Helianthus annuus]
MESHFKMDVHAAFNEIEVKKAEERRMERERRLAEEATQKNKGVIDDTQEAGGSSSQPEIGGSSNQEDIEMVEAEDVQEQVDQDFMMVGESSEPLDAENVLRKVVVIQRKKKAREVLLLEWRTDQFVLVGDAYPVPYNIQEVARQMKVKERRRKAMKARGEIVDDDSDVELFGDDEEEDKDDNDEEKDDKPDDHDDKGDDDND